MYVESICTMTQSIAQLWLRLPTLRPHVGATKSGLWGYDPKDHVSKQIVNTWQHQLLVDIVNADVSHSRTHVASAREIPSEFRAAVAAELDTDARNCGETTTDVIHDIMLVHGRDVSPGFLGTFRQDSGNRVTQAPQSPTSSS